ncbi:hypothetical protein PORCRE_74 [Porphyromonas crevioricanis JCM 15906]|uniref:Uncharacterized protein n=2 Tax=Porphyromonas crevioricanis TaxID=393921 RepID=A0A2X4PEN0_9PORP|nr:hypothetical protein PORCRE_74 [Porphyromonas crevioricanis JCM 15906]GAD07313.1 hypothetical protein PORCAN_933 [Porphyromonas crevioricanis JCM 13913]SJZ69155.1 hypothetical protein SAMN02745203_00588 [Porphyromonas crevioricanis]SQH72254.1 Uncharacterised protein [Porphyromonas crevioricanis]
MSREAFGLVSRLGEDFTFSSRVMFGMHTPTHRRSEILTSNETGVNTPYLET